MIHCKRNVLSLKDVQLVHTASCVPNAERQHQNIQCCHYIRGGEIFKKPLVRIGTREPSAMGKSLSVVYVVPVGCFNDVRTTKVRD